MGIHNFYIVQNCWLYCTQFSLSKPMTQDGPETWNINQKRYSGYSIEIKAY